MSPAPKASPVAEAAPADVGTDRASLARTVTDILDGARHEARFIVQESCGTDRICSPQSAERALVMARRRGAGEPLQYVFGHWPFRTVDLVVDRRVLIPRPETEQVVEVALGALRSLGHDTPVVVDAGTGSGAIALALWSEVPDARVWATEASAEALEVAAQNVAAVCRDEARLPVQMVQGSWLDALPPELHGAVDLVISNPPYVAADEWAGLDAEVRSEPRTALVAGPGSEGTPGLADVESVLVQSVSWLARPGLVVVELAPHQAERAAELARSLGYDDVRVAPDLAGRPRALVAHVTGGRS